MSELIDPFAVLRRLAEPTDARDPSEAVDPVFSAELVAAARRRLTDGSAGGAGARRSIRTDDEDATDLTVTPSAAHESRHPVLFAAACVALVVSVVAVLAALGRSGGDDPIVTVPVSVTTSVPPPGSLSDDELTAAILLDASELGLEDVQPVAGWEVRDVSVPDQFDVGRYEGVAGCSAFDRALEPLAASAHRLRIFGRPPSEPATQTVVVFADDATAQTVFDTYVDPSFAPCLESYAIEWVLRFGARAEAPFELDADAFAYFTYEQPTGQINAGGIVRVGRTLTLVDASIAWYEPPRPLMTEQEFGRILEHVVERAAAALAGAPVPNETSPPPTTPEVTVVGASGTTAP